MIRVRGDAILLLCYFAIIDHFAVDTVIVT